MSNKAGKIEKENFLAAIDTLKLYRRAELMDEQGRQVITDLYVDPLPGDHVLNTIIKPNTTFLVGRKGTGKSTIIQRAQESLNENKNVTWAYVDIKTLFESSTSDIVGIPTSLDDALPADAIKKIYVFKSFIVELVKEIKKQITKRVESSMWDKIRESLSSSTAEIFERLDEFIIEIEQASYIDVSGGISASKQEEETVAQKTKLLAEASVSIGKDPKVDAKLLAELIGELEKKRSQNFSQVYIRVFKVRELILRLREIMAVLNVKHIYIFVDDFSELPRKDMEEVVDTLLAPFNNWSEEFIKLKVAVYPGRLYLGNIDRSKVDEVYLDIYKAYGRTDVADMESKAVDFTRRLVTTRINHFCKSDVSTYLDIKNSTFWDVLYYSCLGNPRILGYILYYCYEENILYGKVIGIQTIQTAARRYYEEKIGVYFKTNKFLQETFEEKSSIFSLKELLEQIVRKAKSVRDYKESTVTRDIKGRTPSSHFHILTQYEPILSTLELNFFLTKYYEMKARDGSEVSIYALNYGLCQQQSIAFGRPSTTRQQRTYFIERIFDHSQIIATYLKINQEIVCDSCNKSHPHEMLSAIESFNMLCPECREGTCRIINLSRKYEKLINDVSSESLLPATELGILKTLHDEKRAMFAKEIALELDCSHQLIGKRGKKLAMDDLVLRDENDKGRRTFGITDPAELTYFQSEESGDEMDFESD